ncbi:MAG: B12-binding domain-containing radical SAM protein [Candidatus Bathyarchaeota archaeon]|nr:B12-binding domain-containing radical SAM protein [Candidatus Bathyarchaeota archaeon]
MRVCLINPPRLHPKMWGKPSPFQPIDLAYVAAVLEKKHNVNVIDAPAEGWTNLQEIGSRKYRLGLTNGQMTFRVKQLTPEFVVITIPFSGWWETAFEAANVVKSVNPKIKTALMGLHPTSRPEECLRQPNIDFVVTGEPELTVLELADTLERGATEEGLRKVLGIGFLSKGEVVINPRRPFNDDLDSLPFPARHLLPLETFFVAIKKRPIRGEIRKPYARVITSRGCPHRCIFCSNYIMNGRKWRFRSPENVVAELEAVVRKFGVKQVDFDDENLTFDMARFERICDLIVEKKLKIEWFTPNGVRADGLDENLLRKMRASGCHRILIAPESGSQRVVTDIIKKNLDLKKVESAVVAARKVGIKVGCFFIIGMIGETKTEIRKTINFALKLRQLGADRFYFSFATPLYGTELYEQAKRGGYLKAGFDDEALSEAQPLIETPEFSAEDLRELCAQAIMINPTVNSDRLLRAIRNPRRALETLIGMTRARQYQKEIAKKSGSE